MRFIGIDVSYKTLTAVNYNEKKCSKPKDFANTPVGHQKLIAWATQQGMQTAQIGLEATGVYHLECAIALAEHPQTEVMVLNPKVAHNFAVALSQRSKTDGCDAEVLAHYACKMAFVPWQCPPKTHLELRAIARRLNELTQQRARTKNQQHAAQVNPSTPPCVLKDLTQALKELDKRITTLQQAADVLIAADADLQAKRQHLCSVTGIAETSSVQILGELVLLPDDMNAKQWVAHAGLDPRHVQSGSSINKKPRLSKAGNANLRSALYMPALVATQRDDSIKAHYQHLINDNGLKKMQALCAVMRKLLHSIHAMFRNNVPFDAKQFASQGVQTA